jgi:hypothetical protein
VAGVLPPRAAGLVGGPDPADYQDAIRKLTTIKLARYDAYAKLKASLLAFRRTPDEPNQEVEGLVEQYAIDVNQLSQHVDAWLRNRYCWSNECISTGEAPVDHDFSPYGAFVTIQRETSALLQRDDKVAELLAKRVLLQIRTRKSGSVRLRAFGAEKNVPLSSCRRLLVSPRPLAPSPPARPATAD